MTRVVVTEEDIVNILGVDPLSEKQRSNVLSMLAGLNERAKEIDLTSPWRVALYLGQLTHESGAFRYDRELWGPTAAQRRYDIRTDLGNTPEVDGDGKRFRGRGPIQITGKFNYEAFTKWAQRRYPNAPDFVEFPDLVNSDPWEGLAAIWYWETRELNVYTNFGYEDSVRRVTRAINGGYNGLDDRFKWTDRAALVLLGYLPKEIFEFQSDHDLKADGIIGAKTRDALYEALRDKPDMYQEPEAKKPSQMVPAIVGGTLAAIVVSLGNAVCKIPFLAALFNACGG